MSAPVAVRDAPSRSRTPAARRLPRGNGSVVALGALLLAMVAAWLLWASAVPFGEAPDEPSHLEVAQFVAAHGRLPVFGPDADMYARLDQAGIPIESHALAPPLTHLVDAALIRLLPLAPPVAARLGSLLAALVVVVLTYAFVRTVLPAQSGLALPAAALVAAVPQFSFEAATVNSDVMALAAALAVACLALRVRGPLGALGFGLALGSALLAKYTAYPAAAVAILAVGWRAWDAAKPRRREPGGQGAIWTRGIALLALAAMGAALVAGPWLAHNWRLYGEPWPLGTSEAAFRALTPAVAVAGAPATRYPWGAGYLESWATITFRSFWAGFDRVSLFAPGWVYTALGLGLAVAAVGLVRLLVAGGGRVRSVALVRSPDALVLVGWPAATLAATIIASFGRYYPVHGRYLLPLLPLVALGLVVGWRAMVPVRWQSLAPWGLVAGMAGLNAYCLLAVVVPHYFGPAATRAMVTVDEPRPGAVAAEAVSIRGWAVVGGRPDWPPGLVGGAPAWHLPVASVWVQVDGARPDGLAGGAGVKRPDVARALEAPAAASAGFAYRWDTRGTAPGTHTIGVCAADPGAAEPACAALPVLVRQ